MKPVLKRTNINITEAEYGFLQKKSEEQGLSMSELIRRILDKYTEEQTAKGIKS
ncbi:MAG: ribbon-helix-helix protein, CopG family [Bacteroidetes bacterium]|nr:ribbon-helix-helix protein, CopG family [Bacteroidota bacterium]